MSGKLIVGLQLCRGTALKAETDIAKCIICQNQQPCQNLTTTSEGRQTIIAAAEIRKDNVLERITSIGHNVEFIYHCSNECYKSYTLKKTLLKKQRENEGYLLDVPNEESLHNLDIKPSKRLRSEVTSRSAPSPKVHPTELPCVICGKLKYNNSKEKY